MMDNQEKQVLQDRGKEIYDSIIIPPELEDIVKKYKGEFEFNINGDEMKRAETKIKLFFKV